VNDTTCKLLGKWAKHLKPRNLLPSFCLQDRSGNFSEKLGLENLKDSGKTVSLFRDELVLAHLETKANSKEE